MNQGGKTDDLLYFCACSCESVFDELAPARLFPGLWRAAVQWCPLTETRRRLVSNWCLSYRRLDPYHSDLSHGSEVGTRHYPARLCGYGLERSFPSPQAFSSQIRRLCNRIVHCLFSYQQFRCLAHTRNISAHC